MDLATTLRPLAGRSLGTLAELTPPQLAAILDLADALKSDKEAFRERLSGRSVGLIFEKHSTRTRVSFEVGVAELGGYPLFLSKNDLQLGRGEPISDTARVLSRYVQAMVLRTHEHERFVEMAEHATVPVINGLTAHTHPCQVLADLQTMRAHWGALQGRRVAWIGDGNNMAHSLMLGGALAGCTVAVASPAGYTCDAGIASEARRMASETGGAIELVEDPRAAAAGADAVVTDVFTSMGQEAEMAARATAFEGYRVDDEIMALAHPDAIFMHCLPAHRGEEVAASVIDGPQSVVFEEAENRLHAQKALLLALLGEVEG